MARDDKVRYFYIKLTKEWFNRAEIQYLESLPNGSEMAYLYLKLLVDSLGHDGQLRVSETIPYTPELIAKRMNTPKKIVKNCINALIQLNAIKISNDKTIIIEKAQEYTNSVSGGALRKAEYRHRRENGGNSVGQVGDNVPNNINYNYNYNYDSNYNYNLKEKENKEKDIDIWDELKEDQW